MPEQVPTQAFGGFEAHHMLMRRHVFPAEMDEVMAWTQLRGD